MPRNQQQPAEKETPVTTESPFTTLTAAAIQLHEAKTSFTNAGFTEDQAMQMVLQLIANGKDHQ